MTQEIVPGLYEHFKGGLYDVIVVGVTNLADILPPPAYAFLKEFLESNAMATKSPVDYEIVVTRACYGNNQIRVRSVENFTEHVSRPEHRYEGPRFRLREKAE